LHPIRARATAGGVSSLADSESLAVTIDTAKPTGDFSIVGDLINGQLATNDPNIALMLNYDGTGTALTTMEFSLDGGATWVSSEDYDTVGALTLPSANQIYNVTVRITDTAGNQTLATHSVRLDTTGPQINYTLTCGTTTTSTSGATCDVGQTVTLTYSATDVDGINSMSATLAGTTTTSTNGTLTFSTDTLQDGGHTIVVTATDGLGNTTTIYVNFAVRASASGLVNAVNQGVAAGKVAVQMQTPLNAKLQAALAAISRGQNAVAKSLLQSFISQVSAQSGKQIDAAYAAMLVGWATDLLSRL
jgi:hypothetical protein